MQDNLKILYKLSPYINVNRKKSMIEFFSYKTNKVQLIFENISNPLNVHACIRTAANFGINTIHYVHSYENMVLNFVNEKNKTNSGLIKWMDIKVHNHMIDCIDYIYKAYDPIILCTDISPESKNILEINSILQDKIKYYNTEESELSKKILNNLFFHHQIKKEQIEDYKNKFLDDENFRKKDDEENQEFIKKLYLEGKFLDGMTKEIKDKKPKILVIVFGNESRGVSNYIKRKSHHKVIIPHFGYPDTSYNLSVSCGMILFHLYSQKILPGSFTDFSAEKGSEILAKNVLNSYQALPRTEILKLGLERELDDF